MQVHDPHAGYLHVTAFAGRQGAFLSVLCKQSFSVALEQGALFEQGLEKLHADLSYHKASDRIGRAVLHGRDLWPNKEHIDLILNADAVAPGKANVQQLPVSVQFEEKLARAMVFGDRHAYHLHGQLRFSKPEPFCSMPLDDFRAYGGVDPTLMPAQAHEIPQVMGLPVPELFPGANPFNPAGMGYWVRPENFVEGLCLPNVERADDLLSPERFFVGDPRNWPLAPRPISWGLRALWSYPRCLSMNRRPHFLPGPNQPQALARLKDFQGDVPMQPEPGEVQVSPQLMAQGAQELALSMRDGPLRLKLDGVHETGVLAFELPSKAPPIEIFEAGKRQELRFKRLTVHLDTKRKRLSLTWACQCRLASTPRQPGGLEDLRARYQVRYADQLLSAQCWPVDRALLHR